jgi:hypothetical protein
MKDVQGVPVTTQLACVYSVAGCRSGMDLIDSNFHRLE